MKLIFESADLLSIKDAATELDISRMTLYRWVESGKIQAVQVGSQRAIPKAEIERLKDAKLSVP